MATPYARSLLGEDRSSSTSYGQKYGGTASSSSSGRSHGRTNIFNQSYDTYGEDEAKTYYPKTKETKAILRNSLLDMPLFASLSKADITDVMNAMSRTMVHRGEVVIQQGDPGNKFYIIEEGECDVIVDGEVVGQISSGKGFGELALMFNAQRAATIQATAMCTLWALGRMTFRRLLATTSSSAMAERCAFLQKVPSLQTLSSHQISSIAGAMNTITFSKGDNIINEGERGDAFFVLKDGSCDALQAGQKVGSLVAGDFFGERALLTNEARNATISVTSRGAEVLSLPKASFDLVLGPLESLLMDTSSTRDKVNRQATGGSSSSHASAGRARAARTGDLSIRMQDLRPIATLGTGTFGRVRLVEHTPTGRTMALKAMQKAQIIASHQQKNVVSEKDVLLECDHPFIIKLYRTFQDRDSIYMLLELVQGGELWTLLYQNQTALPRTRLGGYDIEDSKFYAACVVSCFEHVHALGCAYRDLKPENLLLDADGYLKMVDFGFAKKIPFYKGKVLQNMSFTLCGTPEYLSPELVLSKGHNTGVDWWALGILIYELITGGTPFADPRQPKIFEKIIHSKRNLQYPRGFDSVSKDIINKLLEPNVSLRLGMLRGGAEDVMTHQWFGGFDWRSHRNKAMKAPYVPPIRGKLDTSMFDEYPEDDNIQRFRGDDACFESF
eukprot:g1031.t1